MSNSPATFFQIDQFLTDQESDFLIDYCLQNQNNFIDSSTSTKAENYRISKVLFSQPEIMGELIERVRKAAIELSPVIAVEPFNLEKIERQITAHNDEGFYRVHTDNSSLAVQNRVISYVIYFHREPVQFTGGDLRIYDLHNDRGIYRQGTGFKDIQPRNKSLVLFASRLWHEVLPVKCPSKNFSDGRFTLNGWIHKSVS